MIKQLLNILLLVLCTLSTQAQIDISEARNMPEGSTVTIEGIATHGSELGPIRYIQDATGGLPAYPGAGSVGDFPADVERGDLVQVTGVLKFFNGLLEVDPIQAYTVISSNNPLPTPLAITPAGLNEASEAELVVIEDVVFDDAGGTFSVGSYGFTQNGGGESSTVFVRSGSALIGQQITQAAVRLTGIASVFNGDYQLLMRDANDLEIVDDFYITSQPKQANLTTSAFNISWMTNVAASSNLRYGTTTDMTNEITNSNSTTNHTIDISGLDAAEFYYVQVFSNNGVTTVTSPIRIYSTASNSSGQMRVYFNHGVDNNYSQNGALPQNITPAALETAIINRINAATTSIDVAVYNINRAPIVAALANAHNNGITVRYIADDETANLALSNPNPPFSVLKGNTGSPLMHNKFFVFDAESEDKSWVIMGSCNMTEENIAQDYNNLVFIQDKALAKCYTMEFEEMWGSANPTPGFFNVKFGEDKTDNTPHLFNINGSVVESYFSPSDNTALALVSAVESADDDLQFALLTFTYNELGTAVLDEHNGSTNVRGIIDNINDSGSEYSFLSGNGINVIPDNTTVQTHHKYAIMDATNAGSDPQVITGSHNWSSGADVSNDENTLIIHSEAIANIFLQEFEARWCEANGGGASCIVTSSEEINNIPGFEFNVFPNPAIDFATIEMNLQAPLDVVISLWDVHNRLWQSVLMNQVIGLQTEQLELSGLPAGIYLVTISAGDKVAVKPIAILK